MSTAPQCGPPTPGAWHQAIEAVQWTCCGFFGVKDTSFLTLVEACKAKALLRTCFATMPMSLTAAVWQGPSVSGDVGYNVATVVRIITHATGKHAHIVVFPELFLSGYGLDTDQLHQRALRPNSTEMEAIGRAAKKGCIAVAVGYPERGEDGEVFNSCAVWNCHGKLVQSYRKVRK